MTRPLLDPTFLAKASKTDLLRAVSESLHNAAHERETLERGLIASGQSQGWSEQNLSSASAERAIALLFEDLLTFARIQNEGQRIPREAPQLDYVKIVSTFAERMLPRLTAYLAEARNPADRSAA